MAGGEAAERGVRGDDERGARARDGGQGGGDAVARARCGLD